MQRAPQLSRKLAPRRALAFAVTLALMGSVACSRDKLARDGRVSQAQAEQYLRDAVRQSSEGVVLDPSQQGLDQIERVRLGEIAQELRGPAAVCFLERAIQTMEPGMIDGEPGWIDVPEGQAKFRARISVDGSVLTTDLIESGFEDEHMEECLVGVISRQHFVESRDNFAYHIDVYYWVSLGFFAEAQTASFAEHMRRAQAEAGVRAKACLVGRAAAGEYRVTGLNLFDREGRTLVNRVDRGELAPEISSCIAAAFKQIRIHREPDAFVRPAAPEVTFTVAEDGSVGVSDERWLELILLEEEAARERRKAELLGQPIGADVVDEEDDGFVDEGEAGPPSGPTPPPKKPAAPPAEPEPEPEPKPKPKPKPKPEPEPPAPDPEPAPERDPSKPGTKIDLSPRRGR